WIARGVSDGAHALQILQQPTHFAALGCLLGDPVLDHLISAARSAHRLAQLKVLTHFHLLVARQEDVFVGLELLAQLLHVFLLFLLVFHWKILKSFSTAGLRPPGLSPKPPSNCTARY